VVRLLDGSLVERNERSPKIFGLGRGWKAPRSNWTGATLSSQAAKQRTAGLYCRATDDASCGEGHNLSVNHEQGILALA